MTKHSGEEQTDKPIPLTERYRKALIGTLSWSLLASGMAVGAYDTSTVKVPFVGLNYHPTVAVAAFLMIATYTFANYLRVYRLVDATSRKVSEEADILDTIDAINTKAQTLIDNWDSVDWTYGDKTADLSSQIDEVISPLAELERRLPSEVSDWSREANILDRAAGEVDYSKHDNVRHLFSMGSSNDIRARGLIESCSTQISTSLSDLHKLKNLLGQHDERQKEGDASRQRELLDAIPALRADVSTLLNFSDNIQVNEIRFGVWLDKYTPRVLFVAAIGCSAGSIVLNLAN